MTLLTKLGLRAAGGEKGWAELDGICSLVSIVGPTSGAAAVSFIALLDLDASRQTNARLADFLGIQRRLLEGRADWSSVRHVVLATERRLLSSASETAARRCVQSRAASSGSNG